ncbi:zf-TFIIB domain-containing protein [Haliea sp. E17]|uniref:zf-TFIIB domain-containing protein n=1 Tax=Haliea sp. E17 TaxID=3401576 RepID=UPI003AAEDCC5
MECPACKSTFAHVEIDGIQVDICKGGCGGIWFDTFEFRKFDEPHEEAGTELLNIPVDPTVKVDREVRINCPKCDNITLMRNFFSVKKEVEIDTCANCAGVWLDMGELNHIRKQYASEEERKADAAAAFDEMFGPELERLKLEREHKLENARRIANMLKFICPSYYLPGNQDGGAF